MKGAAVVVCLCAVLLAVAEATTGGRGRVYPFPITATLECHAFNDLNEMITLPAPTINLQASENDVVWLPREIPYAAPRGTIDATMLKPLLPRFDDGTFADIQSIFARNDSCDPMGFPVPSSGMIPIEPDDVDRANDVLVTLGFNSGEQSIIRGWWDRVGFTSCDVPTYEWTRLPDYYFPQYYCAGRCSAGDCSVPLGQKCLPSFVNMVELPVLRWDCCWNPEGEAWVWQCGWRNVNIQLLTRCRCACRHILTV